MGARPVREETPYRRAKREGKAYVKILVDNRPAAPGEARIELEGAFTLEQGKRVQEFMLELLQKAGK